MNQNLADLCADFFLLIQLLRESNEYGDKIILRQRIKELFENWEQNCKRERIEAEEIQMARFALVAFIDETIFKSNWNQKQHWVTKPLQLEFFNRFDAGEEFFKKLDELRQRSRAQANLREVYYLCMTLGFEGRYQLHDQEKLRWLINETYQELAGASSKSPA